MSDSQDGENSEAGHSSAAISDMFGRGLVYAAVFALQSAAMIVITPLTGRAMTKNQFGKLVIAITVMQLLIVIVGLGMGTAIQRHRAHDDEHFRSTRALLGTGLILTTGFTALLLVTGPVWSAWLRLAPFGPSLRLAVVASGLTAMGMMVAQLLRAEDRLHAFLGVMFPVAIASQILGLAFVLLFARTAAFYLAGMCVGAGAGVAFGVIIAQPLVIVLREWRVLTSMLAIAVPLVANGIAYQVLNIGDRIVVQAKLGNFAVGRYQLAYNAAGLVILILVMIGQNWLPTLFEIKDITVRRLVLADSRDAWRIPTVVATNRS